MLEFFDVIFGSEHGYVCLELFQNGQPKDKGRVWVEWPKNREKLKSFKSVADQGDLYFRPVLFADKAVGREHVRGSLVSWADVDSAAPADLSAGVLVGSGTSGHVHAYWPAGRLLEPAEAERWSYYNAVTNPGVADMSGYDLLQLLRVPGTKNHKTDPPNPVTLERCDPTPIPKPDGVDIIKVPRYRKPDILPSISVVLEANDLSDKVRTVLDTAPTDRSGAMFRLACMLSEEGMSADAAYVVLNEADERWGKFKGRHDREIRLTQLIARAYEKVLIVVDDDEPEQTKEPKKAEPKGLQPVGWGNLTKGIQPIKYLIKDVLRENGLMLLIGDSGVGKSQLAIQMAAKLCIGAKKWAGFEIAEDIPQQKVLYLSLEMDRASVAIFTDHLDRALDGPSKELLTDRFLFHATYDLFKLDIPTTKQNPHTARKLLEDFVRDNGITGIVLDTLQAATSDSLQNEVSVRGTLDWMNSVLRHKYGCWMVVLAHPRKLSNQGKKTARVWDLNEVYGARLIGDVLDSAFALDLVDKESKLLQLVNLKSRFNEEHAAINLRRDANLWLEPTSMKPTPTSLSKEEFDIADDAFDLDEYS